MITRKIGKILRGNSTPFQLISATILGSLIAFLPPIGNAPGLYLFYFALLLVLNANLFIATLFGLFAKLLYLITLPILLIIGGFLVDGPLEGVAAFLVNAPITAWFGFEYYITLSGIIIALIVGASGGIFLCRIVKSIRTKLSSLEEGSSNYKRLSEGKIFRIVAWLVFGGLKGKKSWKELAEQKKGLPVRPIGLAAVGVFGFFLFMVVQFFDTAILTSYLRDSLTKINGATVDLDSIEIDLGNNRVTLMGLAFADPESLANNRFQSEEIVADLSGFDLLAKKVVIDQLLIKDPISGEKRNVPGIKYTESPKPESSVLESDEHSIMDWIKGDGKWKSRLETAQRLYYKFSPYIEKSETESEEEEPEKTGVEHLSLRERLTQEAEALGYANVRSTNLLRESPRLVINDFKALGLKVVGDAPSIYDIEGEYLSDNPILLEKEGKLLITGKTNTLSARLTFPNRTTTAYGIQIRYKDLEMEELTESMKDPSKFPLKGGQLDFNGNGTLENGILNLPLEVIIRNSTVKALGQSTPLSQLPVNVVIGGSIGNPKIKIPTDALSGVLKKAGEDKAKSVIQEKVGDKVGDKLKGLFGN